MLWFNALRLLLPWLLGALVLGVGYYKANHWCNSACVSQTNRADAAEATLEAVKKREAALAVLWAAQVDKTEQAARTAEVKRNATFTELSDRARRTATGAVLRLGVATVGVLNDASTVANSARTPPVDQKPPDAVPRPQEVTDAQLTLLFVDAAKAYADAFGKWRSCVDFYEALQSGQMYNDGERGAINATPP